MIKEFREIDNLASSGNAVCMAVLAPQEREFLLTVKIARDKGYVVPYLVGKKEAIERLSGEIEFDISQVEVINVSDPQEISDKGISMLFGSEVDLAIKGHIPTAFIYRSILRNERSLGKKQTISVNTLWDIPGVDHLVSITDTGVNIAPDYTAKVDIIRDAVFLMDLLGYKDLSVAVLSSYTGINLEPQSLGHAKMLKDAASRRELGACRVMDAFSMVDILLSRDGKTRIELDNMPHVILVPDLDAGNVISKLDFMLDVTRRSLVLSSRGPVIIPSRSDVHTSVIGEVALGVVVSRLLKMEAAQ